MQMAGMSLRDKSCVSSAMAAGRRANTFRSRTLLPQPDGPTTATIWPGSMDNGKFSYSASHAPSARPNISDNFRAVARRGAGRRILAFTTMVQPVVFKGFDNRASPGVPPGARPAPTKRSTFDIKTKG